LNDGYWRFLGDELFESLESREGNVQIMNFSSVSIGMVPLPQIGKTSHYLPNSITKETIKDKYAFYFYIYILDPWEKVLRTWPVL
jgi:hypothetical protein